MNEYLDCSKVYIEKCEFGFGVFAQQDMAIDDIIEKGIMMVLKNVDGNENPHLFTWSDDRKVWSAGSGCLPFYNYSDNPNMKKIGDLKNNTMTCVAIRDIKKGEQITNTYYSAKWRECFKELNMIKQN